MILTIILSAALSAASASTPPNLQPLVISIDPPSAVLRVTSEGTSALAICDWPVQSDRTFVPDLKSPDDHCVFVSNFIADTPSTRDSFSKYFDQNFGLHRESIQIAFRGQRLGAAALALFSTVALSFPISNLVAELRQPVVSKLGVAASAAMAAGIGVLAAPSVRDLLGKSRYAWSKLSSLPPGHFGDPGAPPLIVSDSMLFFTISESLINAHRTVELEETQRRWRP